MRRPFLISRLSQQLSELLSDPGDIFRQFFLALDISLTAYCSDGSPNRQSESRMNFSSRAAIALSALSPL